MKNMNFNEVMLSALAIIVLSIIISMVISLLSTKGRFERVEIEKISSILSKAGSLDVYEIKGKGFSCIVTATVNQEMITNTQLNCSH